MQYELTGVPTDGYLDFYIWPSYAEKGCLWMIPKCDGRANVGLVTEDRPRAKALDEFIDDTHSRTQSRSYHLGRIREVQHSAVPYQYPDRSRTHTMMDYYWWEMPQGSPHHFLKVGLT